MQIEESEAEVIIKPGKSLVAEVIRELKTELLNRIKEDKELIIDLDGIKMVDSSGLGVLVSAQNSLKKQNRQPILRNIAPKIRGMPEIMRLDKHFKLES